LNLQDGSSTISAEDVRVLFALLLLPCSLLGLIIFLPLLTRNIYISFPYDSLSLAIGSPLSAIATTIAKIAAINAKHGPFDACVLVGDTFKEGSDGSELDGLKCELA